MDALPRRRALRLVVGAASFSVVSSRVRAETYPARPVHLIVPYPAGISPDIIARLVGEGLSKRLSQSVVIENKPGAGGNIGTELVVKAPPDGYTLLLLSPANAFNAALYKNLHFNFPDDIAFVGAINSSPFIMVTNPSVPAKTVSEFISYAKKNPGKLNFASGGIGTPSHVYCELFKMMTGLDLIHVPYRGNPMPDLLGGQVQFSISPIATVIEYIRAGKLRSLGVTAAKRIKQLPEVPAIGESVQGYEAIGWLGIGAPKGTPSIVVKQLNREINSVLTDSELKGRFVHLGIEPMSMTPAEFQSFVAKDTEKWAKVIKYANISAS